MQEQGLFAAAPIWLVFVGTLVLGLGAVDAGFRLAQLRARAGGATEKEAPVGAMVGATLGLFAFLLAFTFGMAADAFHERKVALLEEATALRVASQRAGLVREPHRSEARRLLRDYVEARLAWAGVEGARPVRPTRELLSALWAQAEGVALGEPGLETSSLFVEAVDEVVRQHEHRVMVRERSRIPGAFWAVLYLIAALSLASMGYHGAVAGTVRSPVMVAVAIAFSVVLVLIADLDRPSEGLINVRQDAMVELRGALDGPAR